jgi:hypothetical protein
LIKNHISALAVNLKNNPQVRKQSIQLISELAGVAASVGNGNHSYKLQRLIAKTTLGFSTAIALRSLLEIILENSRPIEIAPVEEQFYVRVFSNDNLFAAIRRYIKKNNTSKIATNTTETREVIFKSLNIKDYVDDDEAAVLDNVDEEIRSEIEAFEDNRGVYVYVEPEEVVESKLDINGLKIEVEHVERVPPQTPTTGIMFEGFTDEEPVRARGSRGKKKKGISPTEKIDKRLQQYESYLFKATSFEEREAVRKWLLELGPKAHYLDRNDDDGYRGSNDVYVADEEGGGEWSSIPMRTADTVILPEGQMEEIIREIKVFTSYEKIYGMLGVPYHHGVLLSGQPGTGKSSAAQAIASSFRRQTFSASLTTFKSDDAFVKFIKKVSSNSIVLLEDVDVAKASTSREADARGVTMGTLLNVLDGVLSPHGCIFILTTNHIENLGEAVIRPGRVDATYTITYLVDEQLDRLCRKFMKLNADMDLDLPSVEGLNITPAEIVGEIKTHIPHVAEALPSIRKFIEKKRIAVLEKEAALV